MLKQQEAVMQQLNPMIKLSIQLTQMLLPIHSFMQIKHETLLVLGIVYYVSYHVIGGRTK